jgi:hypothetical protein
MALRIVESPPDRLQQLLDELRPIAGDGHQSARVGALLAELRDLANGGWPALVRSLRPDLRRPDAWAARLVKTSAAEPQQRAAPAQEQAPSGAAPGVTSSTPQAASREHVALADRPVSLDDRAAELYPRLRPLLGMPRSERRKAVQVLSKELGMSARTIYRHLDRLRSDGAAGLNRRHRRDRGKARVPEEVQQTFLQRRLDPQTRHESIQLSIDITRRQFPELDIGEYALRQLERRIPAAVKMKEQEWRRTFLPSASSWDVPHPNHTWTFDMSQADLFVWDGPGTRPYRPAVISIVDEASQCCLWCMYTQETPSVATLAASLLHAMLPKSLEWPMCGVPLHLHADNGKVQLSHWLTAVTAQLGEEIHLCLDLRKAQVRSPWMDGHVENFYRILHTRLEPQLAGFCGNDPKDKPECYPDIEKPTRDAFLTLEDLNTALHIWIPTEYHGELVHERLKCTRAEYWRCHAGPHIKLPDATYLRHVLMQRVTRRVRRGRLELHSMPYWHQRLQSYEGTPIEVRWDPADLTRVLVMATHGEPFWAERQLPRSVDNPSDLGAVKRHRKQVKEERQILRDSVDILAGSKEADRQAYMEQLRTAQAKAPIQFPRVPQRVEPEPDDDSDLDVLLGADGAPAKPEPIELYPGLEI